MPPPQPQPRSRASRREVGTQHNTARPRVQTAFAELRSAHGETFRLVYCCCWLLAAATSCCCCCWLLLLLLLLAATTGWKDGSGNKVVVELSVNSRGKGRERKGGRGRGREREKGRGQAEIVRAELGTKGTAYLAGIAFSPRWINAGPPSSSTSSSSSSSFS